MKITDSIVRENLTNVSKNGTGTHYVAQCPFCGRDHHLYVQRETKRRNDRGDNVSWMWECKRCGENGRIRKLFAKLNKLHLIDFGKTVEVDTSLEKKIVKYKKKTALDLELETQTKTPPLGWKRVYDDDYLRSRGFVDEQFDIYHVGRTRLLRSMRDYVVALVMENGECKGYVGRSIKSKTWIDAYNNEMKANGSRKRHIRYQNSVNTDFGKLLMGIDEITSNTKVAIIVEGFFDKTNVDKLLELYSDEEMKCVCSFGKKLSEAQIQKLHNKGIDDVILLYDPDAVDASKKYAFELTKRFGRVRVGFTKEHDPGDLDYSELSVILTTLESPLNFSINKVQKKL